MGDVVSLADFREKQAAADVAEMTRREGLGDMFPAYAVLNGEQVFVESAKAFLALLTELCEDAPVSPSDTEN